MERGSDNLGRKTRKDQKAEAKHQVDAARRADVLGKMPCVQWLAPVGADADARGGSSSCHSCAVEAVPRG